MHGMHRITSGDFHHNTCRDTDTANSITCVTSMAVYAERHDFAKHLSAREPIKQQQIGG